MATPTLPAPPRALAAILDAASDGDRPLTDLAALVSADPSFAGCVLQIANTIRYRGSRRSPFTDVQQATLRLGARTLRNFALCQAARSCASRPIPGFDIDQFWEDSLRRAVAAELLAGQIGAIDPQEAFTVGLMMELGVVALLQERPDQIEAWRLVQDRDGATRLAEERRIFGTSHTDVNAELAKAWDLPEVLALPLVHHHQPDLAPEPFHLAARLCGAAEALAAVVAREDKRSALVTARRALKALGIEDIEPLLEELSQRVAEAAAPLGIKVGPQPTADEILKEVNRKLIDMNLSYEDLVAALERTVAEKEALAQELDERNQELSRLNNTDLLTQIPNRKNLFEQLDAALERTARHGGHLSLIVADIDHFKRLNDTWGHVFGDVALTAVAQAIATTVRATDLPARTGGEEFAVILPDTDRRGAWSSAQRILARVAGLTLTAPTGETVQVTVSLGIATLSGPHRGVLDKQALATHLYNTADAAMYKSKEAGRKQATQGPRDLSWVATRAA